MRAMTWYRPSTVDSITEDTGASASTTFDLPAILGPGSPRHGEFAGSGSARTPAYNRARDPGSSGHRAERPASERRGGRRPPGPDPGKTGGRREVEIQTPSAPTPDDAPGHAGRGVS